MSFEIEHIFIIVVATYYTISFKNMSDTEFSVLFTLFASLLFIIVNKSSFDEWKQNTVSELSANISNICLHNIPVVYFTFLKRILVTFDFCKYN